MQRIVQLFAGSYIGSYILAGVSGKACSASQQSPVRTDHAPGSGKSAVLVDVERTLRCRSALHDGQNDPSYVFMAPTSAGASGFTSGWTVTGFFNLHGEVYVITFEALRL